MPTLRGVMWRAAKETFPMWERLGLHVTPVHFYEPVPDTRALPASTWDAHAPMVGVDLDDDAQLALLDEVHEAFASEYSTFPTHSNGDPTRYFLDNGSFSSVDGEMLHSLVRRLKPRRIIEVGSGNSTLVMAHAIGLNAAEGHPCDYTVCDPFPGPVIRELTGIGRILDRPVQEVGLAEFERLGDGDILFIDSSHVLTIGSDVRFLFLEVLPRLAAGVVAHIHDIFLPAEYPRRWVLEDHHFWNEQYLLQAFLAFNSEWRVVWAASHMHLAHGPALAEAFPSYRAGAHPGSFWIRRRHPRAEVTTA